MARGGALACALTAAWAVSVALGVPTARAESDILPRFEAAACPGLAQGLPEGVVQALSNAHCGYLVVPEDRLRPGGRSIRLVVAVLPAMVPGTADPILYMPHGPGGIALLDARSLVDAGLNRHRDLILMSQRGTFLAEPALTCAPIDDFVTRSLALRFYAEPRLAAQLAATRACRAELAATGARLEAYNTTESEADFADLMRLLGPRFGYSRWNIFAASYGTFLARSFMRDHPQGIRSVILDSTIPLSVTLPGFWSAAREAFDNLFAACAAQPSCSAAHPRLEETFTRLVNELEARPLVVTIGDARRLAPTEIVIDGGRLVDWLRNKSYQAPEAFRPLPDLIDRLARRDPVAIDALAQDMLAAAPAASGPDIPTVGYGLAFGVVCREWHPFTAEAGPAHAGRLAFPHYPASITGEAIGSWAYADRDCDRVWDVVPAPPEVRQAPPSAIPALLLSGEFDAVASLTWTRAAAASLTNATVIVASGVGHFVTPHSPCAQDAIAAFLDHPGPVALPCLSAQRPLAFTQSGPRRALPP